MAAVVDVVNVALQEIGAQATVSSINPSDGSTEGDAASILYVPKIQALHRAAHWNFARRQGDLTLLKAAVVDGELVTDPALRPPTPWMYEYAYPSDCIKARFVLPYLNPATGMPVPLTTGQAILPLYLNMQAIPFVVGTDRDINGNTVRVILCNHPQAILVYTADFTQYPNLWDPHFYSAATSYLGMWLVNALSRNRDLWIDQQRIVQDVVAQARISDGNEGLQSVDHIPDWIQVRGALGAGGWYFDNLCYAGWDALGFPSGLSY